VPVKLRPLITTDVPPAAGPLRRTIFRCSTGHALRWQRSGTPPQPALKLPLRVGAGQWEHTVGA
jgi:hypothetical protein